MKALILSAFVDKEDMKKGSVLNSHSKIPSTHRRTGSEYGYPGNAKRTDLYNISQSFSSPARSHTNNFPPPFHLMASLFLDGRKKPERRAIVYLNPALEDFSGPDGMVGFKSRLVKCQDGRLSEHSWVFKEVGIETLFDKMLIRGGQNDIEDVNGHFEDDLIDAMNTAKLGAEGNLNQDEKSKVGQITVLFYRVTLGEKWLEPKYSSKHKEGDKDDVDMDGTKNEITHTAG